MAPMFSRAGVLCGSLQFKRSKIKDTGCQKPLTTWCIFCGMLMLLSRHELAPLHTAVRSLMAHQAQRSGQVQ